LDNEDDSGALARVGAVLNDKWTLERLLGIGGMGAVYAGRHRNGALGAIKVLHAVLARNKAVRERFRREGYAANKVGHQGVVKVIDDDIVASGPDEGTAYLVMELLEGESLQDRLENGPPIDEPEFLRIADSVLDVLQAAHKHGVVHRDLKPENLFFARDEEGKTRIKVLDFGLARLLEEQSITAYGLVLGTPSFMSPEQASGKITDIDGRTDMFALAATGFRLRAGRRIHEADDAIELVKKMASVAAPPLRSVAPDASEPYARVIDRALQFDRDDRYKNAAAMQADVRRPLAELEPGKRKPPPPPAKRAPPAAAEGRAKAAEPTIEVSERDIERPPPYGLDESIRIPKRRSVVPWLALTVLAGIIGAKVWFVMHRSANDSDTTMPSSVPDATPGGMADAASEAAARPHASGPSRPPPRPPKPKPSSAH
jgi:serine/threonine protein kinase